MKDCPQKWSEKRIKENDIFSMDKYLLNIWVENTVVAIQHIGKFKKVLLKCPPPTTRGQTNPFAYSCGFIFNTSYKNGIIGHGGGGRYQNAQKQFII